MTMSELIPVHQENGELWADARTLHAALQVGRDFSTWIQGRLAEVDARETEEFVVLDGSPVAGNGFNPKPRRDYWLTLDLAKEIAMLERNEIGKQIRRYFIEAEKQLRAKASFALPSTLSEALQLAADQARENERLTAENAVLAPQAQQFQALMQADGTYSMAGAAKLLGTGEVRLFALLRERHILMDKRRSGAENHNVPYQQYLERGYFTVVTSPRPDGLKVTHTTRVTTKGLAWLERNMRQQRLLPVLTEQAQGVSA